MRSGTGGFIDRVGEKNSRMGKKGCKIRMYQGNIFKRLKYLDFMAVDVICLEMAFAFSCMLQVGPGFPYGEESCRIIMAFLCLISLCVGLSAEEYRDILKRGRMEELKAAVVHACIVCVGILICLFFLKLSRFIFRAAMLIFPFLSAAFLYVGRTALKPFLRRCRSSVSRKRSILLVGCGENYRRLVDDFMDDPEGSFTVSQVALMDSEGEMPEEYRGVGMISGEEAILLYICQAPVDEVFIALPIRFPFPDNIIQNCRLAGITVHMELAKMSGRSPNRFVENLAGYMVMTDSFRIVTTGQMFLKRSMDIVGAFVGCVLTGFLFLFLAPAIYISSPGPIFFRQTRIGKNGRTFTLYKFRSMYPDAEERKKDLLRKNDVRDGMMFKLDDDPRIIRGVGKFIREYSLDEFPQFFNVLKGEMSLVGTRPPTVDEWEKYQPAQRVRLAIKPGVTGLWQVSGRSKIRDFEKVVELDKSYIMNWSLWLDIRILIKTVGVVLKRDGAK